MPLLETASLKQKQDYDCGRTAFAILFRYHYPRKPVPDWGDLADPVRGIGPDAMELFVRKEFGNVCVGHIDLAHLKFLSQRTPVLCIITVGEGSDHWTCVRGVTPTKIYTQDPDQGRQSYTDTEWLEKWRDAHGNGYSRFALTGWVD